MADRKDPRKVLAGRIGGNARNNNPELEQRARDELTQLRTELHRRQAEVVEAVLASFEEQS